jgi:hypothetical protein
LLQGKRFHSFNEETNNQALLAWLEERLTTEKRQCDAEIAVFMPAVLDPMEKELHDPEFLQAIFKVIGHFFFFFLLMLLLLNPPYV